MTEAPDFNNLTNIFEKIIDCHGSYHVGRYKASQTPILWGSLDRISNEGSSKYQLQASLVATSVTIRLILII